MNSSKEFNEYQTEYIKALNYILLDLISKTKTLVINTETINTDDIKNEEKILEEEIGKILELHITHLQEENSDSSSFFVDSISIIELSVAKIRSIRHSFEIK